jgi:HlyD family secretion protein
MRAKSILILVLLAGLLAGGAWWWLQQRQSASSPQLRTATVERGTLTASVAASGTLAPTVQVQVGSQVSGQIQAVLVDFNDIVRRGQVIARLDPQSIEFRVRQAEADVEAARAQVQVQQATVMARRADLSRAAVNMDEARRNLERTVQLLERNFISPAERDRAGALVRTVEQEVASARAQLQLAESQVTNVEAIVRQREAQLSQARIDLDRTVIRAPVDGIVIKRSIQPGQTVAASLQAPELFVIAQDLRDMQVEVAIDEAEVSRVRVGQQVTFTVDAFAGRTFEGEVRQVRKAAQNVQNVITYTAVVSATNERQALLPGMTANVRIVTDVREGVLKVPNAALRFRPPNWVEPQRAPGGPASAGATLMAGGSPGAPVAAPGAAPAASATAPPSGRAERSGRNASRGRVFVPGAGGAPQPVELRLGLSDGRSTEVLAVEGDGRLQEGDLVYIGTVGAAPGAGAGGGARMPGPRLTF